MTVSMTLTTLMPLFVSLSTVLLVCQVFHRPQIDGRSPIFISNTVLKDRESSYVGKRFSFHNVNSC